MPVVQGSESWNCVPRIRDALGVGVGGRGKEGGREGDGRREGGRW